MIPCRRPFSRIDEIIAIHQDQIARYGGSEGIRDWGLLQSAVAMPAAVSAASFFMRTYAKWQRPAYFTSSRTIPFSTETNASGAVAAYVFLALNNRRMTADNGAYADLVSPLPAAKRQSRPWRVLSGERGPA